MHENIIKTYRRHGKRYIVLCDSRHHWRNTRPYGLGIQQKYLGKCPTTCKHHHTYVWEK